jgi:phage major head subunit gpT-like protein
MDITPSNLQVYQRTLNYQFMTQMQNTATFWRSIATEMPSGGEANVYPFLATIPGLREWVGPRVINNASLRSYTLLNKHWEDTVGIDKNKLADDQHGFFGQVVGMLGMHVAQWNDRELARVIEAGTTELCWDGQFFFDTDHPIDPDGITSGVNVNKLVGAGYDIAVADPLVPYAAAKAAMATWKREDGLQTGTIPNIIMVHPNEEKYGKQIRNAMITAQVMGSNTAAAGVSNVFQGELDLIINPYLTVTSGRPWYLLATQGPVKPLIWQTREAASLVARTALTLDNVFNLRRFEWGVDLRGAAGYSFPGLMFRMSAS